MKRFSYAKYYALIVMFLFSINIKSYGQNAVSSKNESVTSNEGDQSRSIEAVTAAVAINSATPASGTATNPVTVTINYTLSSAGWIYFFVDGNSITNTFTGGTGNWTTPALSAGTHTIKILNQNNGQSASIDYVVNTGWDWKQSTSQNIYFNNPGFTSTTINMPWYDNQSYAYQALAEYPSQNQIDFYESQGWFLVYKDFGTVTLPANGMPWFVLYNKYRGVLRIFFWNSQMEAYSYGVVQLTIGGNSTPLFTYNPGIAPFADNYSTASTDTSILSTIAQLSPAHWCFADFNLAGYDTQIQSKNCWLNFKIIGVDKTILKVSGTMNLNNDEYIKSLGTSAVSLQASGGLNSALSFVTKNVKNVNSLWTDLSGVANFLAPTWYKTAMGTLLAQTAGGIGALIPGIGSLAGFVTNFIGLLTGDGGGNQASAPTPIVLKGTLSLSGDLTTQYTKSYPAIPVPGSAAAGNKNGTGLYNNPLGVFNLVTKPKMGGCTYQYSIVPTGPEYSSSYQNGSSDQFFGLKEPLQIKYNPNSGLTLVSAQYAFTDSVIGVMTNYYDVSTATSLRFFGGFFLSALSPETIYGINGDDPANNGKQVPTYYVQHEYDAGYPNQLALQLKFKYKNSSTGTIDTVYFLRTYPLTWWNDTTLMSRRVAPAESYCASGTISSNTEWSSDVIFADNVTISNNAVLTIQGGTNIYINPGCKIVVSPGSKIKANFGSGRIHFQRACPWKAWDRILLYGNDNQFSWCQFDGGTYNVDIQSKNNLFTYCAFQNATRGISSYYAYSGGGRSSFTLDLCDIGGFGANATGIVVTGTDATINQTLIYGSTSYGVYTSDATFGTFTNNAIWSNGDCGIMATNGSNIYFKSSSNGPGKNSICWNEQKNTNYEIYIDNTSNVIAGQLVGGNVYGGYNKISAQTGKYIYNLALTNSGTGLVIPAIMNRWGQNGAVSSANFYGSVDYSSPLSYDPTNGNWYYSISGSAVSKSVPTSKVEENIATTTNSSQNQFFIDLKNQMREVLSNLNNQQNTKYSARLLRELNALGQLDINDDIGEKASLKTLLSEYRGRLISNQTDSFDQLTSEVALVIETRNEILDGNLKHAQKLLDKYSSFVLNNDNRCDLLLSQMNIYEQKREYNKALEVLTEVKTIRPDESQANGYIAPSYQILEENLQQMATVSRNDVDDSNSADSEQMTPTEMAILQNYPNPFNPSTTIHYQLSNTGYVTLKVYDMLGREVAKLVDGVKEIGSYTSVFNASKLASGVYFARFVVQPQNGNKPFVGLTKLLLMK